MFQMRQDWLRWRALATPARLAVLFEERSLSYAELDRFADRLAGALAARQLQPGDRVATHLDSSTEAIALIHAVARVGAVLVPLNTRLTPTERARQLSLVEPKLLVVDDASVSADGDCKTQEIVTLAHLSHQEPQFGPQFRASCPDQSRPPQAQSVIFTSGTTGAPKGVQLSFDNHFWSATASAYHLGVDTNDRWLNCLPLYHVGGLAVVFRSCLYGTAIVLQRSFDLEQFQRCLREDEVTLTSLVPTMLHRLLQNSPPTEWPQSLRMVLLGGAAATADLLTAANEAGVPIAATYGLTETASQVATALPAEVQRKPDSVGRPLLFTETRIADSDGNTLPHGQIGEILVRGPQVMAAYYRNPPATDSALREGWLYTGDMGRLDADGDLYVVQRRNDMIVSGGENIYPAEVEAALREHPAVADVCVVGLPDAEWGQRCAAAVQLRAGETLSRDALLSFSRTRLAGYKQPAANLIRFVDALPQTASGKIARQEVERQLDGWADSHQSGIAESSDT